MTTEVLVCVLCRPAERPRNLKRPGRDLLEAIENIALRDDLPFRIRPVDTQRQRMPTLMRQCSGTGSMHTRPISLTSFDFKPMF